MNLQDEIKQNKPFASSRKQAIVNIVYTGNFITDRLVKKLKQFDINDQHYNLLRILKGKYPAAKCPGEIKEVLINKRGDLTRLLDKLEKKGWVIRETNPESRRKVDVFLTKEGLTAIEEISTFINSMEQTQFENNLSEEEANQLNYLLDKLRG